MKRWKVDGIRDNADISRHLYFAEVFDTKKEAVAFWTLCKMQGCEDLDLYQYRRTRKGEYTWFCSKRFRTGD